jgi:hypothetical protein
MDNTPTLPDLISQLKIGLEKHGLLQFEGLFAWLVAAWRGWESEDEDDQPCLWIATELVELLQKLSIQSSPTDQAQVLKQLKNCQFWAYKAWDLETLWNPIEMTLDEFCKLGSRIVICFFGSKLIPSSAELRTAQVRFAAYKLEASLSIINSSEHKERMLQHPSGLLSTGTYTNGNGAGNHS